MQKGGEKYRHGYCESCKEKEDREELLKIERQQQDAMKRKTESLYKRAEIPDNIKSALLDKMVIRKGSEDAFAAMKNLRMDKRWVYLHGDNSVGKSFLIGATINSLIAHHVPVLYVNESQLFDRIRFTWDKHSTEKESDIFNLFKQASVIFWDEFLLFNFLDRESPLWKYERMYSFIEYCSEHSKIMVFASNIKPSSNPDNEYGNITDRAGKRIVARLKRHDIKCIKMSNAPFC
jgi:DNA replication protein DnaC